MHHSNTKKNTCYSRTYRNVYSYSQQYIIYCFVVFCILLLFCIELVKAAPFTPVDFGSSVSNNIYDDIGWVPRKLIPPDLVDKLVPVVCQGVYLPLIDSYGKPGEVTITSNEFIRQSDTHLLLKGEVEGVVENIRFRGDKADYYQQIQEVTLQGNVSVFIGSIVAHGDRLWINLDSGEITLDGSQFVFGLSRVIIQTHLIERDNNGVYHLYNTSYTTCEPNRNDWRLYGKKIQLDYVKGWGTVTHAVLYIKNIPIFYFPWFTFPLDNRRKTGLLVPTITNSKKNGFMYSQPLYLNLAPNYDMLIEITSFQKRGILLQTQNGLLTTFGENTFNYGYVKDNLVNKQRNYHILYHEGGLDLPIRTRIDYGEYSDPTMYEDFNLNFTSSSVDLINQQASLGVSLGSLRANIGMYDYQPLATYTSKTFARKPGATLAYTQYLGKFGFDFDAKYDDFYARRFDDYTSADIAAGERLGGERSFIRLRTGIYINKQYGGVEGYIQQRYHAYSLRDQASYPQKSNNVLQTSVVRGNIIFERNTSFFSYPYSQTLEFEVQGVSTPFIDQNDIPNFSTSEPRFTYASIFAVDRFTGEDKFGDTRHISYGMSTRLFDDDDIEFFRFQIGQIYYTKNRKTTLNRYNVNLQQSRQYTRDYSPIAARTILSLTKNVHLTSDAVYDDRIQRSLLHRVNINKTITTRSFINGGYNFIANDLQNENTDNFTDTEQISASGILQVTPSVAIFGRSFFDKKKNTFVERMNGLEYESCCWRIMFGAYHRTDFDKENTPEYTGYFLIFRLKGLTGDTFSSGRATIGNVSDALEQAIPGITFRQPYIPD